MTIAAFTIKAQGTLRSLYTNAWLSPAAFENEQRDEALPPKSGTLRAVWDTGATGSVVNMDTANMLNFQPVSFTPVSTVNGNYTAPVFICDIYLPSGIVIPSIEITGGQLGSDLDMLIGMDVITLGDFTITNLGMITWFTFRVPSMQRADYKVIQLPNDEHRCPCGTTKKYKNCCGPIAKKILAIAFK